MIQIAQNISSNVQNYYVIAKKRRLYTENRRSFRRAGSSRNSIYFPVDSLLKQHFNNRPINYYVPPYMPYTLLPVHHVSR